LQVRRRFVAPRGRNERSASPNFPRGASRPRELKGEEFLLRLVSGDLDAEGKSAAAVRSDEILLEAKANKHRVRAVTA
jgi:hypothetical protein